MASSSTRVRNYDVFLSFRGEDTRRTIVSYLYQALCNQRINTFKDDQKLQIGDNISEQLIKVIRTSLFAVVVISENYATSTWCLDELLLIMELYSANRIKVVPIFYGVEPTNVRHQTGTFVAPFRKYEELGMAPERISQWRRALNQVSHLAGFDSTTYLDEATIITDTVNSISSQLRYMRKPTEVDLVEMEAHMLKMHFLLNMESANEVLMVGIWGMGGVGKTTIAQRLYDRISRHFPAHYFIKDIKKIYKDKSLSYLQLLFLSTILYGQQIDFLSDETGSQEIKATLGHQRVLVVLDGVDKAEQVHALAKDTSWFGPGSRIIITTRDKGLLNSCGVNNVHEVNCLDNKASLKVFEKLAFGGRPPPSDGFEQLFIRASRLAHGLPSALVAYASHLSENTTIQKWEDELRLLEIRAHKNVLEILRHSYDILDEQDKTAFLQVACVLNGYPFSHVASLLDDGCPSINHLDAKSLINISKDGYINMHFLFVQTGRAIVRQESKNRPSRQRFLWDQKEIHYVLDNNIGTYKTEGVTLHMCEMTDTFHLSKKVFNDMHSIKFLKFFQHLNDAEANVQLSLKKRKFPPKLKLLHWDACPLKTLSSFRHRHLVQLDLRYSNLERLWGYNAEFCNLVRLDVTGSTNLIELPDLSTARKLEELTVDGCMKLRKIPESLMRLNHLTKLNAIRCDILKGDRFRVDLSDRCTRESCWQTRLTFPDKEVTFDSLSDLSIEGQIFINLLDLTGNAEHLSFGSDMKQEGVLLRSLKIMWFDYMKYGDPLLCNSFRRFPDLTELRLINLNIKNIPEDISQLYSLEKLDLSGNDFKHLPETMSLMPKLKYLNLRNCSNLRKLPPLAQVETLILSDCVSLDSLMDCATKCLVELWLDNCLSHLLYRGGRFTKLRYLDLSKQDFVSVPKSIRKFSSLETLFLSNCKNLKSVEELPLSVKYLYANDCDSLERVSLSPNHSIKHLDLTDCPSLKREEHLRLMHLNLYRGNSQEDSRQCASSLEIERSIDFVISAKISQTRKVLQSLKSLLVKGFSRFS